MRGKLRNDGSSRKVPDADRAVVRGEHHGPAVGRELEVVALVSMVKGLVARTARVGLPDSDIIPHSPGEHALAFGAEGDLAIVDPMVRRLSVVGLPAEQFMTGDGMLEDQMPSPAFRRARRGGGRLER